jgi:predicted nucleic acid-binding protein
VIREQGSAEVAAIWERAERIASSPLLYPEARAALTRAEHMKRIGRRRLAASRVRVDELWRDIGRVQLDDHLVQNAGDLAETHVLRGSDAVHLASALSLPADDCVLVSSDERLLAAARNEGLTTSA